MNARFRELHEAGGEGLRYALDERAAIHEFDGKAAREDAERLAAEACDAARARKPLETKGSSRAKNS